MGLFLFDQHNSPCAGECFLFCFLCVYVHLYVVLFVLLFVFRFLHNNTVVYDEVFCIADVCVCS